MKEKDLINFYENKGFKVLDKISQLDIIVSEDETIMFHKVFLPELTIKILEESLK